VPAAYTADSGDDAEIELLSADDILAVVES
jgi:hypothetical protein